MEVSSLDRMKSLVEELNNYRNEYYNNNNSIISDYEYDKLFDELKELEDILQVVMPNSPTQQVGYEVVSNLEKVKHEYPLLSLDKTKSIKDIVKFADGHSIVLSAKMDGLTVCLTYENGYLIKAETRGDGFEGELITHNINTFSNVPKIIPYKEHLVVVGEAILTKDKLDIVNRDLSEDKQYKHVRNLASGTVRQLDSSICAKREPLFIAWDCKTSIAKTLSDKFNILKDYGFTIVPGAVLHGISPKSVVKDDMYETIDNNIQTIANYCSEKNYPIDGIVITYNNIAYGDSLGGTSHHFKNAIAYKFYDEETVTHLRDIEWSMGRTGVLTPVAIFDEIVIDGTDVGRASLSNVSIVKSLHLGIGDEITVFKSGQIIPQVSENLTKSDNYVLPTKCPYCNSDVELITNNESTEMYCTNPNCDAKLLNILSYFVSKPCMNIVGLSEASLKLFLDKGWITNPIDIYTKLLSKYWDIVRLEGWGEKSASKLKQSITNSVNIKLENAINALGITGIGVKVSKDIAKYCKYNWHNFIDESYYNSFCSIEGIGDIMYKTLYDYITNNKDYIIELFSLFNFTDKIEEFNKSAPNILNKTFVITGSLTQFKNRNELVNKIESLGGTVTGSVSNKTDYLINNDINSDSSKNRKAKELNIPIITEEDFIKLTIGTELSNIIENTVLNPGNTTFVNTESIDSNLMRRKSNKLF